MGDDLRLLLLAGAGPLRLPAKPQVPGCGWKDGVVVGPASAWPGGLEGVLQKGWPAGGVCL